MNFRNLDMLRACLALMVLLGHARWLLWMPWHEWKALPHATYEWALAAGFSVFRFGSQAVTVFFSLSGFFIHFRAAAAAAASPHGQAVFSSKQFLQRRARRISPPYYAALIFGLLLDTAGRHFFPEVYTAATSDALINENFQHSGFTLESVTPAILAQPGLLGWHFGSNGPLWSIGYEVFYYAIYPLFMVVWMRSRWLAYRGGLALSASCWFWPLAGWWSAMLVLYPIWLAGALLAEWLAAHRHRPLPKAWFWGMLVISAGSLAWTELPLAKSLPFLHVPVRMLMGASTIAVFAALPSRLLDTNAGRLLEWLGIRSYSLYIFHFPVLVLLSSAVFHLLGARPAHGWFAAAAALLAALAGLAAFSLVERHFLPARQDTQPASP
ncbi:MAG: hypothetical protein JWO08_2436 [Verrucomicrobiaceae bacterium]|nr:hypothetical protein [Verrucomicrobiaceae bacterium]